MLIAFLLAAAAAADTTRPVPAAGPKVLIYVDMDGSSGVSHPDQVFYPNPEYFASRKFITSDLNAAIRGLKAGGAGEIVVVDAHGSGNIESPDVIVEQMDKRARFLFRDRPFDGYLEAVDSSFQAIVAVGMHAEAASRGFMAHTGTLEPILSVNGERITESGLIAHSAARWGIPVIMVAGDDVLAEQIRQEIPTAEYAIVKTATSRARAEVVPQPEVRRRIELAAKTAIEKLGSMKPYQLADSYRFEIGWQNVRQADLAGTIPGVTRVDSITIGFTAPTFPEGQRLANRTIGVAGFDRFRWMMDVVRQQPNSKVLMRKYLELLVTNWLEPENLPKRAAPAPRTRFWGAN